MDASAAMDEKSAKFVRIRETLLEEIRKGVYGESLKSPSESALVERFAAARETVRKALSDLAARGLVQRRKGAGTFVTRRGLRRSGLIGLLVPDVSSAKIFRDLASEIGRLAWRNGYGMVVRGLDAGSVAETRARVRRIARELVVQHVEGVIFRPLIDERLSASNREVVRIFRNAETPVVLMDSDVVAPPGRSECDLVAIDNVSAGRRVAEHLLQRGRRRVAFLMNGTVLRRNANWSNRLFGVAGEMALRRVGDAVRLLDFRPDSLPDLKRLYASGFRPDAIVCGNDETAVRLMETLLAMDKRIPQDVAVVGFDDIDLAASFRVPLTTVRQPVRLIAKTVLRTLLARIVRPDDDPREIRLSAPLVVRAST